MLANFFYYLVTGAEAVFSVFGIRSFYEQPPYAVVERLGDAIEIRSYGPRLAVETTVEAPDGHTAENASLPAAAKLYRGCEPRQRQIRDDRTSRAGVPTVAHRDDGACRDNGQAIEPGKHAVFPSRRARRQGSTRAARQSSKDRRSCTIDTRGSAILRRSERRY